MNTISLRVSYRPVRLGWCVEEGDLDALERALRFTHCFWGGRFNPVIPVGDPKVAARLVNLFRVDALFGLSQGRQVQDFIKSQHHLPWPLFGEGLFQAGYQGTRPAFLDVGAALAQVRTSGARSDGRPPWEVVRPEWQREDPLGLVMLAMFGGFAASEHVGSDYGMEFSLLPGATVLEIGPSDPIPPAAFRWFTPSAVTAVDLHWLSDSGYIGPGLYLGSAGNFTDLTNYWNLSAAGARVQFYDRDHTERFDPVVIEYCHDLEAEPRRELAGLLDGRIAVWSQRAQPDEPPPFVTSPLLCRVDSATWNGLSVRAVIPRFESHWCLGMVDETGERPSITLQLPKPPVQHRSRSGRMVVSLSATYDLPGNSGFTLNVPFLPELNEYLGREACFTWNCARAEADGIGIVEHVPSVEHLTIRALEVPRLFAEVFKLAGIEARVSSAGRIASRVVAQMGGVQGCRAFKIRGVRDLLRKYTALESFTRSAAVKEIGAVDPSTGQPQFTAYEQLVIERGGSMPLTPASVFEYLCRRGVFRVGLEFRCSACGQRFWRHLDDVKTLMPCEYCGSGTDISGQLKDRDWRFRRSGLFGRDNNQEGAVPVTLLLQQLETALGHSGWVFSPALELKPTEGKGPSCETDLAVLVRGFDGRVQLGIGECKSADQIDENDVENLSRVAAAFPRDRIEVFLLFAKTVPFSSKEIALCRAARVRYRSNVILLSDRELEPYFMYERADEEFEINRHAVSLEDMALNTDRIYFDPRPKNQPRTPAEPTV